MLCPNCGEQLADNLFFCPNCNTILNPEPIDVPEESEPNKPKLPLIITIIAVIAVGVILSYLFVFRTTPKNTVYKYYSMSIDESSAPMMALALPWVESEFTGSLIEADDERTYGFYSINGGYEDGGSAFVKAGINGTNGVKVDKDYLTMIVDGVTITYIKASKEETDYYWKMKAEWNSANK